MKRHGWIALVAVLAALALFAGCTLFNSSQESKPIDPPRYDYDLSDPPAHTVNTGVQQETMGMTLYFKDAHGMVAPVTLNLPRTLSVAKASVDYMVKGGPVESYLPAGFTPLLPEGTRATVDLIADEKLAVVDFSREFRTYDAQDERKIMEALTWTLTGYPSIERVSIRLNGYPLTEMPVNGTPVTGPLTRAIGINIERAEGVEFGRSTPVTLYFRNQTADQYTYYVPVTRMIHRTDNAMRAVVEQLIQGPSPSTRLESVLPAALRVYDIKPSDDLITVNLTEELIGPDNRVPEEAVEALALSLTENTGASRVQIIIGNSVSFTTTGDVNVSRPVLRPVHINPHSM